MNNVKMTEAPATERNPTVEAWIESFGVSKWEFAIVDLDDIDRKASHANQARFKAIDQMTVNRYAMAAAAGAKFPPLVLARVANKLVTIDGNHRVDGLPLGGIHEHPAYVIDEPEAVRSLMTATANTVNGLPFTEDEVRHLALDLHNRGELSYGKIAVLTGLSESQVQAVVQAHEARGRAKDKRAAGKIPDNDMRTIGRIVSDDALDVLVAAQAGAKRVTGKELNAIVTAANRERSDAARVRVVRDKLAAASGEKVKLSRELKDADKFTRALGGILNCNPLAVAMAATDRQALINKIDEVVARLADVTEALS